MVKLPKLTPEQKQREKLLFDLKQAVLRDDKRTDTSFRFGGILWFHFTDWYDQFDLPALLKENLLSEDGYHRYEPQGNWRDYFPPTAYRITAKARMILENNTRWVFDGIWNDKAE